MQVRDEVHSSQGPTAHMQIYKAVCRSGSYTLHEMNCLALFMLAVLVAEASGHDCLINCDPETGLRQEELFPYTFPYEVLSQCVDPAHCDDSTPGTGHKLISALTEDLIVAERCYSFCYTNVRLTTKRAECSRLKRFGMTRSKATYIYAICSASALSPLMEPLTAGHRRYFRGNYDTYRQHLRRACLQRHVEKGGVLWMCSSQSQLYEKWLVTRPPSPPVHCRAMFGSLPVCLA